MDNVNFNANVGNHQSNNLNKEDSNKTKAHSGIIQSAFAGKENLSGLENRQVRHVETEQALHKIESRVLSTHIGSSNLKKVARSFAEGQAVKFPAQYHARELHQVGDLQSGFDPTDESQVEKWTVFYAKVCVLDADPDFKKFYRESPLGKDMLFMNALSKGAGYFKECAKQEGLTVDAANRAEEIAEVFARVQAKFQRTSQQVNEYEENRQINREILSIMRSQHHHLEGPLGEGMLDRSFDFDTQNIAIVNYNNAKNVEKTTGHIALVRDNKDTVVSNDQSEKLVNNLPQAKLNQVVTVITSNIGHTGVWAENENSEPDFTKFLEQSHLRRRLF